MLAERPGELVRRLRPCAPAGCDKAARERVLAAFTGKLTAFATPVLLTLRSHLPARVAKAPVRVYWPKGRVAMGESGPDERAVLPPGVIRSAVRVIDVELLRRFGAKPPFYTCIADESLGTVVVPFNERSASRSAVSLPRGSCIAIAPGKLVRLFLHWCQPEVGAGTPPTSISRSRSTMPHGSPEASAPTTFELKTFGPDHP